MATKLDPRRIDLAREFLRQFQSLERTNCTDIEWLMLKFSCTRPMATKLMLAAREGEPH